MGGHRFIWLVGATAAVALVGCVSLVAPYDPEFDRSLNQFSSDTAKFLAAAKAGGSERLARSKEAVAYYATAYNLLDRLSQRAAAKPGFVPCPGNAALKSFSEQYTSRSALPDDYAKFDCLEAQLYYVRFNVDALEYAQDKDGTLNRGEATAVGGELETSISGAIRAFLVGKG